MILNSYTILGVAILKVLKLAFKYGIIKDTNLLIAENLLEVLA